MIRPSDLSLIGLKRTVRRAGGGAQKFVVGRAVQGWRLSRPDGSTAIFHGLEAATDHACLEARAAAAGGVVGLVVVKAAVHELHCFTPAGAAG